MTLLSITTPAGFAEQASAVTAPRAGAGWMKLAGTTDTHLRPFVIDGGRTGAFVDPNHDPGLRIRSKRSGNEADMNTQENTMALQIADAAKTYQQERTGHLPQSVTVVLGEDTLVITLHGALSPAEKVVAQSAAGAAQVQEFHRQLFASSSEILRLEIARITGREVREAAAEFDPGTGTVVHAFTTGTMVEVFHLAKRLPDEGTPAARAGTS